MRYKKRSALCLATGLNAEGRARLIGRRHGRCALFFVREGGMIGSIAQGVSSKIHGVVTQTQRLTYGRQYEGGAYFSSLCRLLL